MNVVINKIIYHIFSPNIVFHKFLNPNPIPSPKPRGGGDMGQGAITQAFTVDVVQFQSSLNKKDYYYLLNYNDTT